MKKILLLLLTLLLGDSVISGEEGTSYNINPNINSKEEMRTLISSIRVRGGKDKIIIANGGIAIYYDDNIVNENFLNSVNGILVESVVYGFGGYNKKTPKENQTPFFNLLLPLKQRGKEIILLEYVDSARGKRDVKKVLEEKDFKGETPTSKSLNSIYTPTKKGNGNNINSLEEANNTLILLNYEKFTTPEELVRVLSYTDFDFLIIDPFIGKTALSKEQVEKIKTRADGTKRKVIAYLSLGEAETYRFYWDTKWKVGNPSWLLEENKNWANNYIVEFWSPEWKGIIEKMQKEIDNSNFDGYFLDTIDSYQRFEKK